MAIKNDTAPHKEAALSYDILSTLREMEPPFSKGQKRIARYITEDYDKAAFMTANRLGKTVGVSESTVVRFAVDLGFDGYPSMQKAMQEMVLNRLTSVQRIEVANDRLGDPDVVSTVLRSDMEKPDGGNGEPGVIFRRRERHSKGKTGVHSGRPFRGAAGEFSGVLLKLYVQQRPCRFRLRGGGDV